MLFLSDHIKPPCTEAAVSPPPGHPLGRPQGQGEAAAPGEGAAPRCENPVLHEPASGRSRKRVQGGIVPHSCEAVGEGGGGERRGALMV
jgi:hypothetical protein